MEILRSERLTWTLRRMSRYGVLGRYLPAFGRIVGQMQHDLFHVYTVDEHILMVVRNLRRFRIPRFDHEYPLLSQLMQEFDKPEILYLAALFHDIAKGRRDHCTLAAMRRFARSTASPRRRDLIAWLVESTCDVATTQKQDLTDSEVISAFATSCATSARSPPTSSRSPTSAAPAQRVERVEGSSSRSSARRGVLRGETDYAASAIAGKKREALRIFRTYVPETDRHESLWDHLDNNYFQRFDVAEIAWHTRTLWAKVTPDKPIVRARLSPVGEGLQVLVYAPDQPGLFARITGFFERAQYDVAAAKIYTTQHGFALDSFQVLEPRRAASTTAT
jgi:[protein-PII] uridylyltransferase